MVTHGARIRFPKLLSAGAVLAAVVGIAATYTAISRGPDPKIEMQADRSEIPAGGATVHLNLRSSLPVAGELPSAGLKATIAEGPHSARIARTYFESGVWHVTLQSKAMPGKVTVKAELPPFLPGSATITVAANVRDSARDGTPDVLRLDDPVDNTAFRSWFTFLAEAQFFRETSTLPAEIADCAGLIRYAYREALRTHDSVWSKTAALPLVPAIPSVRKYEYPFTPWGAALFRTGPESLGEFADAGTLLRYNAHLVSRDLRQARPGDLLFFRQEDAAMPYHSMIYLGRSQVENAAGPFIIYHTGPSQNPPSKGEVRRPSVTELLKHPDPAWHPVTENPHYLGVYRWNILWQ
jgi:uncharacterized protein YfaT (DUF1175 family)